MPLVHFEHINEDASWDLWHIEESLEELEKKITLNDIDRAYIASFKNDVKRREWLASRVTVRHMLTTLGEEKYAIKKDDCGKPHLINCRYHLSISHSNHHAAVILHARKNVGIDIEQVHEKIRRIEKKFLSEQESADAGGDLEKLCIYWSAKEVLYKIYGRKKLELIKDLYIHPFTKAKKGSCTGEIRNGSDSRSYTIRYQQYKGFVVAYSW